MDVSRIATAILAAADTTSVCDLVFKKAKTLRRANEGPALSTQVAMSFYKGSLEHVVAIASHPGTDPVVLSKFVKDTRVSVRHALIGNPSLPYADVLTIALWALVRSDGPAVASAMGRVSAEDFVHLVREASNDAAFTRRRFASALYRLYGIDPGTWAAMAAKLSADPELVLAAAAFGCDSLTTELAVLAYEGRIAGVTVTRLLKADPDSSYTVIRRLLASPEKLTCDLADALVHHCAEHRLPSIDAPFKLVEPGATSILLNGNHQLVKLAVEHGVPASDLAKAFPAMTNEQLASVVACEADLGLDAAQERSLVQRYLEIGGESAQYPRVHVTAGSLLCFLRHRLDDEMLLDVLRRGSVTSTMKWIEWSSTGDDRPNRLRRGLVRALAIDSGLAFSRLNYRDRGLSAEKYDNESLLSGFSSSWWSAPAEVVPELVELCDAEIGKLIYRDDVTRLVYPLLKAAFGSDPEAWETYLTLASGWNGTFSDLVSATCNLVGSPVMPAPPAVHEATETVCEQLTLL